MNIQNDDGDTALHICAKDDYVDEEIHSIAKILLGSKIDKTIKNKDNKTAHEIALSNENSDIVQAFFENPL